MALAFLALSQQVTVKLADVTLGHRNVPPGSENCFRHSSIADDLLFIPALLHHFELRY